MPSQGRFLAAFGIRSYRFQWSADLLTSWAFEMENLILGWYVLVTTNSVFLLTLFGALQFAGTLLSPYFGTLADRVSRRGLLAALRAAYGACALVLASLSLAGLLAPWHVFVVALISGLLRPSDLVVRHSLIADTVPAESLTNAMGLSRTTVDSARIVGTLAGAGLFSFAGFGAAYVMVTLFYAVSAVLTTRIASGTVRHAGGAWSELKLGIRYIALTPALAAMMSLAFLINLTAFPLSHGLLPYVARDIYGIDANGLAHLLASYALGALAGSLWLAWSGRTANAARIMIIGTYGWYLLLLVFVHFESKFSGMPLLALIGLAQSLCIVAMSVALLQSTAADYRGRVMGVRMLAVYGLPIGLLLAGALVERIGFAAQTTLYALVGLVAATAIAYRWRSAL